MKKTLDNRLGPALLLAASACFLAGCVGEARGKALASDKEDPARPEKTECRRIVSIAPHLTEVVFALGLGDRVVGVSSYCEYPPEVKSLPKVGGLIDPNYEAIVTLRPDLVVMTAEMEDLDSFVSKRGIKSLALEHESSEHVYDSIAAIGRACGREDEAARLVGGIKDEIARVRKLTAGLDRPRVMVVVSRELTPESAEEVYIAGKGGFYDEMIAMSGGDNVYKGDGLKYPKVGLEGILVMDPEVIVDFGANLAESGLSADEVKAGWNVLSRVSAVRNGRVYVMSGDYSVIPGPRFARIVEDMSRAIHPEADWEKI